MTGGRLTPGGAFKSLLDQAMDGKGEDSKLADSKRALARLPQAPASAAQANALLAEPLDKTGMAARKAAARAAQYGTTPPTPPAAFAADAAVESGELQAGAPRLPLQPGVNEPVADPRAALLASTALDGGDKAALPQLFIAGRPGTTPAANAAPAAPPAATTVATQAGRNAYARAAQPQAPAAGALRDGLAAAEGTAGEPCRGYTVRNHRSGALGRYQLLPVALTDIGWKDGAGRWTERAAAAGVQSEADFLARPAAQEAAMAAYLQRTNQQLKANGALSQAGRSLTGIDGRPVTLTESGLVAAAHRQGAGAVARWLEHRTERPDAPLTPAQRSLFQTIEARLRNFAAVPVSGNRVA
ncbi:hypothetical protein [Roseomonas sp. USHLN139]|uniref:hypothetical protein n=1 Tax=Roseomonas sp. USHLN139 TaxID=3081298 RepID=UPI003B01629A